MLVLFDHGTPSGIAPALVGHTVVEARERGWDKLSNGDLLNAAEAAGFKYCSRQTRISSISKTWLAAGSPFWCLRTRSGR